MASPQPNQIDLLAVMLVDLRATIDAQKRLIVTAQASTEEYRVRVGRESLDDIGDSLAQLTEQMRVLSDGLNEARKVLRNVRAARASGSPEAPV